jgi:hypothetical protein
LILDGFQEEDDVLPEVRGSWPTTASCAATMFTIGLFDLTARRRICPTRSG